MKRFTAWWIIGLSLISLVISLPNIHAEEQNLIYDAVGNLITGDGYYRTYDSFNHLVQIRLGNTSTSNITEEFTWHPIEERIFVKKEYYNNGSLKAKVKYLTKNTLKITNSSGTYFETYVYQNNLLVSQIDANGDKYSIHNDHIGSASLVFDSSGNEIERAFYEPFGIIISGGSATRYDYTGKEFDSLVNEYNYGSRMYNPSRIKFDKPDLIIRNVYNSQDLNHYSFAANNPYLYVDADGNIYYKDLFYATADTVSGGAVVGLGFTVAVGGSETIVAVPVGAGLITYGSGTAMIGLKNIGHAIKEERPEDSFAEQTGELIAGEEGKIVGTFTDIGISTVGLKGAVNTVARGVHKSKFALKEYVASSELISLSKSLLDLPSKVVNYFSYTSTRDHSTSKIELTNSGKTGGSGCKNCVVTDRKGVEKIAQQLKRDVIKSLTEKINKNKNKK